MEQAKPYLTVGFRNGNKYNIPLSGIKCIIKTSEGLIYLHLKTEFVGPFKNVDFIKGGLDALKSAGVVVFE